MRGAGFEPAKALSQQVLSLSHLTTLASPHQEDYLRKKSMLFKVVENSKEIIKIILKNSKKLI